jgi:hypothetical protein
LERLHPLPARDLQATMTFLRQNLEAFAARRMQISGCSGSIRLTLSDAIQELRDRTVATGQHAITQTSVIARRSAARRLMQVKPSPVVSAHLYKRRATELPRSRVASYNPPAIRPTSRSSDGHRSEWQLTGQL